MSYDKLRHKDLVSDEAKDQIRKTSGLDVDTQVYSKIKIIQDPKKIQLIRNFKKYITDHNKIIIDSDKLADNQQYRILVYNLYLNKIHSHPDRFVMYRNAVGFTTEFSHIYDFQIYHEKFFPTYFKLLFSDLSNTLCEFCNVGCIHMLCSYCSKIYCKSCFEDRVNFYFTYNNQFMCLHCRNINIIGSEFLTFMKNGKPYWLVDTKLV